MKELLLIRHAKSDWDHPGLPDHDRPLNARGLRDAPAMAAALKQRGVSPDRIVSSTAVRAMMTAKRLAGGMDYPEEKLRRKPELYLAPPAILLAVVQQLDEEAGTVMIVGHNPGMHEAAAALSPGGGPGGFPTLSVARFEIAADYWGLVEWGSARLVEFLTPRSLGGELFSG